MRHSAFWLCLLFSLGSANGAGAFACAAVDTSVSIDDVFVVTLGDRANGATRFARAAGDASISDYICHFILPPV